MSERSPADLSRVFDDLPQMPREVVEQWLGPYVQSEGWPPPLGSDGVPTNRWRLLLGLQSLEYWRRVRWELKDLALDLPLLAAQRD